LSDDQQKDLVLGNLVRAVHLLWESADFSLLMPEVRVNLVYALPGARRPDEVAAIEGRITVVGGRAHAPGLPNWGASDHMARLIIEARKYAPAINAGINFRCDDVLIEIVKGYCSEKGLTFGWIDRTKEPAEVAGPDRSSMPWKMSYLQSTYGSIPRLFYEGEGWGKEPLFVALGKDAMEVAEMAIDVAQRYRLKVR
jgi:predicted fused transcriptional regulator/phosphomethylpyrimidine kinase